MDGMGKLCAPFGRLPYGSVSTRFAARATRSPKWPSATSQTAITLSEIAQQEKPMDPKWLEWAKRLQAIGQNGLACATDSFDIERYESVREIAAEIVAIHSDVDLNYVRDVFPSEGGHATPKVDVRGAVFRADTILLVRERQDGLWTLPGGWADVNESPSEAVVREVYEESG